MTRQKILPIVSNKDSSFNGFFDSESPHYWMEHPSIQFLISNSRQIGYAALIFLLLLVVAYRFLSYRSSQTERDFVQAKEAVQSLSNPEKQAASLLTLQTILNDKTELQAKYDGIIAQTLLTQGKTLEAKPYIERTFARVKNEAPPYDLTYAKTSLLIAEGNSNDALKNAYLLKDSMLNDASASPTLYAFNLIRIAFLEKEIQNKSAEQKAWTELKEMADPSHPLKLTAFEYNRIMTHFDDQGASLNDYIK